jgi:hypothetical protein
MEDVETLRFWIRVMCVVASIGTTAVPILYAFSPWRTRLFGRLFMLQALSFAAAIDLTTLFAFWQPKNILVVFWIDVIVLTAIAVSTSLLTLMMWLVPRREKRKQRNHDLQ